MKYVLIAAALLASSVAASADPSTSTLNSSIQDQIDPDSLAIAHQILDIASPPETRNAKFSKQFLDLMNRSAAAAMESLGPQDPDLMAIVSRLQARMQGQIVQKISDRMPEIYDAIARAYARRFSHDQLVEILKFAQTDTGRKYLQSGPELAQDPDVVAIQRKLIEDTTKEMPALLKAMTDEVTAYAKARAKGGKAQPVT